MRLNFINIFKLNYFILNILVSDELRTHILNIFPLDPFFDLLNFLSEYRANSSNS